MKIGLSGRPKLNSAFTEEENSSLNLRLSAYLSSAKEERLACLELPYNLIFSRSADFSACSYVDKNLNDVKLLIRINERLSEQIDQEISMCTLCKSNLATILIKNSRHCRAITEVISRKDMKVGLITKYDDEETMNSVVQACCRNSSFTLIPFIDLKKHTNWNKKAEHHLKSALKRAQLISDQKSIFLSISGEPNNDDVFNKILNTIKEYEVATNFEVALLFSSRGSLYQSLTYAN